MDAKDLVRLKAKLFSKAKKEETFTKYQMMTAIDQFLTYGEETYNPGGRAMAGHQGYYAGDGWAARALRYLKEQLSEGGCVCDGKK